MRVSSDWNGPKGGSSGERAAFARGCETGPDAGADRQAPRDWRHHTVTAAALQRMTFPPVSFVVPGLIAEGLTILAGRPKIGKSWLALESCLGVAAGHSILGGVMPVAGDVLYCALEDNRRRLHRRINKLLRTEWPERLILTTSLRRLDDGGVEDISDWCDSAPEPRLIVLDTLAAVRPRRNGADSSLYETDYRALEAIRALANQRGLAVLVLHYTRKMDAEDPIDTISGSLGLAGCADSALVMSRSSQGTTLYLRGREAEG
jgi:predicted ATP-dependent serine protease